LPIDIVFVCMVDDTDSLFKKTETCRPNLKEVGDTVWP